MAKTVSAIRAPERDGNERPALFLGLSGDDPDAPPARFSLAAVEEVRIGRGTERVATRLRDHDLRCLVLQLPDAQMSSQHAVLKRFGNEWSVHDDHSKNGTWIGSERVARRGLIDGDAMIVGHTALVFRTRGGEVEDALDLPAAEEPSLRTLSPWVANHFASLISAARSEVPIELAGDSGTGKELVARAVHALSKRSGAFVAFNCGSSGAAMIEAELFGHRRGAFTGAHEDRLGLVRSADHGTLFLDEIAELSPAAQAALLRVLQEHRVRPVGSDQEHPVDLRLITASLKELDAEVTERRFREDLRARVFGVRVRLPKIRDRIEDLGWLTATLLRRTVRRKVSFSADAVGALYAHPWPLNIRELERALAAAGATSQDRIELRHLPGHMQRPAKAVPVSTPNGPDSLSPRDREVYDRLVAALVRRDWNVNAVARELDKDPKQIRRWLQRFGLTRPGG